MADSKVTTAQIAALRQQAARAKMAHDNAVLRLEHLKLALDESNERRDQLDACNIITRYEHEKLLALVAELP